MVVLKIIGIILAIIVAMVILIAVLITLANWLTLPFAINNRFYEQNQLIKEQTEAINRLNETISKSSKD